MGGSACEEGREGSRGRTGALHGKVNTIDDFTNKNASHKVLTFLFAEHRVGERLKATSK